MRFKKVSSLTHEVDSISQMIFIVRGKRVMIDRDLAALYLVPTKALNQAVKRNIRRCVFR